MKRSSLATLLTAALVTSGAAAPAALAAPVAPAAAQQPAAPATTLVVKVAPSGGTSIDEVVAAFDLELDSTVLASRGIYLVSSRDAALAGDAKRTRALAKQIATTPGVDYAEPDLSATVSDSGYHSWAGGPATPSGGSPSQLAEQPAVQALRLAEAHATSTGAGATIAVLDTGVDADHPALAGRVGAGADLVDDDATPDDARTGVDTNGNGVADEAVGHGTFVAGLALTVAPDARVLPFRVLDSDGQGSAYVVAEAVLDASAAGADVINLSFGTLDERKAKERSRVLTEAIEAAERSGAVVVAAAGNDASSAQHHPASEKGVLSVTALDGAAIAGFADHGKQVDVAAPGVDLLGPVAGGGYARWSGTSMASPLVAGQGALLAAQDQGRSAGSLVKSIEKTSVKAAGPKIKHGAVDVVASLEERQR